MDEKIKDKQEPEELQEIDKVEIEPLEDDDLEDVSGGLCSISSCSNKT